MAKFDSPNNAGYEAVSGELFKWLKKTRSGDALAMTPSKSVIWNFPNLGKQF